MVSNLVCYISFACWDSWDCASSSVASSLLDEPQYINRHRSAGASSGIVALVVREDIYGLHRAADDHVPIDCLDS